MKLVKTTIKCGNITHGVYLLDDIKERLNERYLQGSIATIARITSDGRTWITVEIKFSRDYSETSLESTTVTYIKGSVTGILLWSGVEVI